jgi:hypothetical protein
MTERSLRTHFASILGFGPFFWSLGAAEEAVDFQEIPVGDVQQADRGAGLDYIGDSSSVCPAVVSCGAIADIHSALYLAETFFFENAYKSIHVLASALAVSWKIENRYDLHDILG